MKKIILCTKGALLMLFPLAACAQNYPLITNYTDLLNALTKAQEVKGVLALHHCTAVEGQAAKEMYGSFNFTHFNAYEMQENNQKKQVIATSHTLLIETKQFGPVYNYVRLRVFPDNSAEVLSEFLNPATFKVQRQSTYMCKLSDGTIEGGITLYQKS